MRQEVGGVICASQDRYLGLPILIGRSKYNTFHWIKERVWNKMSNWKHKFLSQVGREVLIRAILQALLVYTMSVFLLSKTLSNDLGSMLAKFWWGHKDNGSKIHWLS